ncbi:MAG: hypothetical protein V3V78_04960, partial [Candidatus Woesearchaeota archaeon]
LTEVDGYVARLPKKGNKVSVKKALPKLAERVQTTFNEGIKKRKKIHVTLTDALSKEEIGIYDTKTGEVLINTKHPSLRITGGKRTKAEYELLMLVDTIDTIALQEAKSGGSRGQLDRFKEIRANMMSGLFKEAKEQVQDNRLYPSIMYSFTDIAKYLNVSPTALRYMAESKIFTLEKEDTALGKEILNTEEKIKGYVPFYDLVVKHFKSQNHTTLFYRLRDIVAEADKAVHPFIRNFGTNQDPCFFVVDVCEKDIADLLHNDEFNRVKKSYDGNGLFKEFGEEAYTLPTLAKDCGMTLGDVAKVISSAKGRGLPMQIKTKGRGQACRYSDFVRAYVETR